MKFNNEVLSLWKHWVIERNRIYVRKEVEKKKAPWTEDSILKEFRFTNVKRWQDRESRWLIENIINNEDLSYEDKIYNCILFRTWNKSKSFEIICGKGITKENLMNTPIEVFQERIEEYAKTHPDYVWYTNAFNTGGIKQSWKYGNKLYHYTQKRELREEFENPILCMPLRMIYLIRSCIEKNLFETITNCKNPKKVYSNLMKIRGFANFLAYQVYVDFTYIKEFPFSEDEFVIAGPGCKRGEDFLFEERDTRKYEDALIYLRDHQKELFSEYDLNEEFSYLPEENRKLTLMDLENSMCELSKYCKVFYSTGRPRNKYHYLN